MTLQSPLATVFANHDPDTIPTAFSDQFLAHPEREFDVSLDGVMHEVWHRPKWLKPLFFLLGKIGILVPKAGKNIPTTLDVIPGYLANGEPYHEWNRTLMFDPPIKFDTTVVFDKSKDNLADQVGYGRFLHMVWEGKFIAPNAFTLATVTNALRIFGKTIYLPDWLWPLLLGSVQFIQQAHQDDDSVVDVDLRIVHPLFGEVFGYCGTFRSVRTPK